MKMFNIPNLLTAFNMLCGVFSILLALSGRIDIAPYLLFLAAIFDFFDGFFARLLKQQGELGKQLDSLADMISFGLAPGVIVLVTMVLQANYPENPEVLDGSARFAAAAVNNWLMGLSNLFSFDARMIPLTALLIPFFSMFRLAKFNIDTRQSESFIGLPTPANTIFFMAFPLLLSHYAGSKGWQHDLVLAVLQPAVFIPVIVIMSLMLVAELPLFALKFKQFGWKGNEIRYTFLASSLILLVLIRFWAIPIIIILYLLLSVANNNTSKNKHS